MLFANQSLAMWAFFLSVIPLIIVYLLRPKAKDVLIPSIIFITAVTQQKKKYARVLSKLIKDPLFLIQLLILLSLIIAIAAPYGVKRMEVSGEYTVIILDGSASMQSGNKLDKVIEIAENHLTAQNSIILAENVPILALRGGDVEAAKNVLDSLPKTATTADLYQAITLGSTLLTDGGGRIIVISDFTNWDGEDPHIAKKLAEGDGIDVSFMSVSA
ncbi:MAG: BatA and WFA domain-containing protein, partial [Methanosarcinales archaeon]|nr:BatA and WFA domain-containing protein [Methanosarcinales archaeon]